jgi:N-acetylglutamate synthase-like GNAT family acetyltransferase
MHCVVLKCNDKVVCTAVIRVFGRQLAEVPLVATSLEHQGQGHCKALFLSIERLLGVLRVDRVVLPAAEGAEGIWLNKFGFSKMANDQVQRYRSNFQLMIFSGSSMLEKEIIPLIIS